MSVEPRKHFYRFRSARAVLGPYDENKGQFDELERQEIYFSPPAELNDAMEGFKDIFWHGDEIVWRNLLRHYLYCLMMSCYLVAASPAAFARSLCDPIIHQTPDDLPETPVRAVYEEVCDTFLAHPIIGELISALAGRAASVRREELAFYLRAVCPLAVMLIQAATVKHGAREQFELPPPSEILGARWSDSLQAVLKHPDYGRKADEIALAGEFVFMQTSLLQDSASARTAEEAAKMFLIRDLPAYYVDLLEKLLYPDWHAACFVADPADPSMWGGYADSHRGVCLKFAAEPNSAGVPTLALYRAHAWSGSLPSISGLWPIPNPVEWFASSHPGSRVRLSGIVTSASIRNDPG